jgi:hypothetical protein
MQKIPRRVSTALLNALAAGVVPRVGLDHIAVGREKEVAALGKDLENVAAGGAMFRFIVGRYGAGKSFLLQLLRNQAMEAGFVVADADLSPECRLAGSRNQGVATYRELLKNMATRTSPGGGAIALILEKWISTILSQVAKDTGKRPGDEEFERQVESQILEVVNDLEGLVHGFDFANVIINYWRGHREDNPEQKEAALRWLRGEYNTKTEAKNALGVRVIIDDETWYDYLKLFAKFIADLGYKGLIVFLDEAVHLYKITHKGSRAGNYDKLLAMFNDAMQGKAEYLGTIVGGTPEFIEDKRRGLHSDEAWKSRLATSRFVNQTGIIDTSAPAVYLNPLNTNELLGLLQNLVSVHGTHYNSQKPLSNPQLQAFIQESSQRLGADTLTTPREIIRDFVTLLNLLQQNPQLKFEQLLNNSAIMSNHQPDQTNSNNEFAEFTL